MKFTFGKILQNGTFFRYSFAVANSVAQNFRSSSFTQN